MDDPNRFRQVKIDSDVGGPASFAARLRVAILVSPPSAGDDVGRPIAAVPFP